MNEMIRAPRVRVVFPEGGAEVMNVHDAVQKAREYGLDLIEISPDADPPVCKILDVGKYKYELEKKMKEAKKHQKVIEVKEIRLRPKTGDHDYQTKLKHMIEFLQRNDKLKVSIFFKGREIAHAELGMDMVNRIREDLTDYAIMENEPRIESKYINLFFSPIGSKNKKSNNPGEENG
ncbi:MAG: translation initiation factor IF-3 [bacterium]|nr:translation initiation factor IF-3 [bacterium]